jgi:hypothetical protein
MSHTPGPWRWEINEKSKSVHLVGGKPQFDLTIIDAERWGMSSATLRLRDVAHDGMNIMHKIHERRDWVAPFPGRKHHADWCAAVRHPDMQLIEAAPDLLEALQSFIAEQDEHQGLVTVETYDKARAAIAKATGEAQ